jgi:NAD(P)-dependent dehydrogenase (short-subunit alcohol dehydrogenase family)
MDTSNSKAHISLKNKVVVIAGGAKNLGGLLARDLAKHGARGIVVHYNSNSTKAAAEETFSAVKAAGAEAILIQGDLTKVANVKALFDATEKAFGRFDIAINTAGFIVKKLILKYTEEDFDKSFAINAKAAFFFMQEAGKRINDHGRIVTLVTSLLAAYLGSYAIYPGSKAPVEHFTRAASKEWGARGISVNAIAPGPMDTPFYYGEETEEDTRAICAITSLNQYTKTGLTDPPDIVALIRFIVTEGWWITGQCIFANGGFTTR